MATPIAVRRLRQAAVCAVSATLLVGLGATTTTVVASGATSTAKTATALASTTSPYLRVRARSTCMFCDEPKRLYAEIPADVKLRSDATIKRWRIVFDRKVKKPNGEWTTLIRGRGDLPRHLYLMWWGYGDNTLHARAVTRSDRILTKDKTVCIGMWGGLTSTMPVEGWTWDGSVYQFDPCGWY